MPDMDEELTAERLARENRRHDRVLAGLLFVLGFLLASFPISDPNSDIWMHLRIGEMIANGTFHFGTDPFSYTTDGSLWVHHAWLSDLLLYGIYALAGGAGLVLLRGVIVALILLLMFGACRPRGSLLAAVLCIALAMLTLSHRLLMRPELASLVLLALTLYLLLHAPVQPRTPLFQKLVGLTHGRLWVFLPPLFALWANLDAWFLVGPVTVALFLIGEWLTQRFGQVKYRPEALSANEQKSLVVVLGISLLACLINPYHYHVFELPAEIYSPTIAEVRSYDPRVYRQTFASPFEASHFGGSGPWFRARGLSLAQWCYYPLALLGRISFVLNMRQGSWSRFLIWLAFFVLSAWQVRNIGFFAVVAGPLTALNLQDWLASRFGALPSVQRRRVAGAQLGRVAVLLSLVSLMALACRPYKDPRGSQARREFGSSYIHGRGAVGWSLFADASRSECAKQMHEWRKEGLLTGRPFFFDWVSQPNYSAWYDAPAQAGDATGRSKAQPVAFLDARFTLHKPETVREYFDARQNLEHTGLLPAELRDPRWQEVFLKYDISHIVLNTDHTVSLPDPNDPSRRRKNDYFLEGMLLDDRDSKGQPKWELLRYIDGRTVILAWTGSRHWGTEAKPGPLQKLRYNPVDEAFHTPQRVPPENGVPRSEPPTGLRAWVASEIPQPPLGYYEADWHLRRVQINTRNHLPYWVAPSFGVKLLELGGLATTDVFGGAAAALAGSTAPQQMPVLAPEVEAEALLAVRAARRAVAENPEHADSYAELYRAYVTWQSLGLEQALTPVRENPMRTYELMAAMRATVERHPEESLRQLEYARLLFQGGFLDLAVQHYETAVKQRLEEGMPAAFTGTQEQFEMAVAESSRRIAAFPASRDQMKGALSERRANFNLKLPSLRSILDAASLAKQQLLAEEQRQYLEKALEILPRGNAEYQQAFRSLVDFYVRSGDLLKAENMLRDPDAMQWLTQSGPMTYDQLAIYVEGGLGRYKNAEFHLDSIDKLMKQTALQEVLSGFNMQVMRGDAFFGLENVLGDPTYQRGARGLQWVAQRVGIWNQMGLLALEAGDIPRATECFRVAAADLDTESPYRPLATRYYYILTGKTAEPKKR
jgi:tetratricopeptide (TPR) repeat protein